jgi:hypothetical protein
MLRYFSQLRLNDLEFRLEMLRRLGQAVPDGVQDRGADEPGYRVVDVHACRPNGFEGHGVELLLGSEFAEQVAQGFLGVPVCLREYIVR